MHEYYQYDDNDFTPKIKHQPKLTPSLVKNRFELEYYSAQSIVASIKKKINRLPKMPNITH